MARSTAADSHYGRMFQHIRARLGSRDGIVKLLRDPTVALRFLRHWIWNANFRSDTAEYQADQLRISIDALERLSRDYDGPLHTLALAEAFPDVSATNDCRDLGDAFNRHGSDKASVHDYHLLYAALLDGRRQEPLSILEIGLGTNNIGVRSNMGPQGRPGASLRAFRDWAPRADVFGADVDRSILFTEDRVKTFWVDQTDDEALDALAATFGDRRFDLIIDDGLHEPHANLNTIAFALPLLKPGGYLVIEDILGRFLAFWQIASSVLRPPLSFRLIRMAAASVCVLSVEPQSAGSSARTSI
jgi:SAM-dependent methyltransferase